MPNGRPVFSFSIEHLFDALHSYIHHFNQVIKQIFLTMICMNDIYENFCSRRRIRCRYKNKPNLEKKNKRWNLLNRVLNLLTKNFKLLVRKIIIYSRNKKLNWLKTLHFKFKFNSISNML